MRRNILLQVAGVALVIAGLALFTVTLAKTPVEVEEPPLAADVPLTPTATPLPPPPSVSPIVRLTVPKIQIDANVIVLGVETDGTMQAPAAPLDVAWYSFSTYPGYKGNAVFAGHLDF